MIRFLARIFITDYKNVKNPVVRQGYGMLCGAVGILLNTVLVIIKLIAGFMSGAIAIFSDALNNLSDIAASLVTLIGFKLSGAEADEEHPFGHGRLEYIAGLIVSFLIIIMAVELLESSFHKIIEPEEVRTTLTVFIILAVSILVKVVMFLYNQRTSKLIDSAVLHSVAMDSLSDVFSTSVVLASVIANHFFGVNIDGIAGIVVGLFILKTGIDSAKDTINPLLGEPPNKEFLEEIESTVLSHEGTLGVHDIIVHNYGPGRIIMSLHVEVPADGKLVEVHDIIDDIEKELRRKYHCNAVIHIDPVSDTDKMTRDTKRCLKLILEEIDPKLSFHDCRIIRNDKKPKIGFDIVVPYKYHLKDKELADLVTERFKEFAAGYDLDITIDKADKE